MRCSAKTTQQGVLVVGGIPAHQQANGLNAAEGDPKEDANANIADQQILAKGNDQPGEDHRHDHQHRPQGEQQAVSPGRNDVFLDQQLEAIGEGLQHTQGTGVLRSNPLLNSGGDFAFKPNGDQHAHHCGDQHQKHWQGKPNQMGDVRSQAESFQSLAETAFQVEAGAHQGRRCGGEGGHHVHG